ncbi:MAG: WecB/TagA/CpsF family glycosyltransferase [Candidatus Binatia bacterium]
MSAGDKHGWPGFKVLGVQVRAVQIPEVVTQMDSWIQEGTYGHFIVAANTHVVMECRRDPILKQAVNAADVVMPDGMPLVLMGRRRGFPLKERAYGPGLMSAFLLHSAVKPYRHYFYGSTEKTLAALVMAIRTRWPKLKIAGTYAPPFRPLTIQEDRKFTEILNQAAPDVLWVGLGCPKQEYWLYEHRDSLRIPVMAGVGQAFDLIAGVKGQAPAWMRDHALEWSFRLAQEPRRLWKRYLVQGSGFLVNVLFEELGLTKFD